MFWVVNSPPPLGSVLGSWVGLRQNRGPGCLGRAIIWADLFGGRGTQFNAGGCPFFFGLRQARSDVVELGNG